MKTTMSMSEWEHWYDEAKPETGATVVHDGRLYHIVGVMKDRVILED